MAQHTRQTKTRTKTRPKTRPKTAPRRASTALAVRGTVLPAEKNELAMLGEEAAVGALGLAELTLTDREEAVLSRPVDTARLMVKPTGEVYLSHPDYTRWFNDAFGRTGWSIRPASRPMKADNAVAVPYLLFIHGQPVAYAIGEQEYFPDNKRQSWGEAIESTVASGLRRCAKRLGVGLELWDRRFTNAFLERECLKVKVLVKKRGEDKEEFWYRRRDDPPFWQEKKAHRTDYGQRQEPRESRPASAHPHESEAITEPQRKRLFTIAKKHGRADLEIKEYLRATFKIGSTKDLTRRDYDRVIAAIEADGPLLKPAPEVVKADDIQWGPR